MLSCLCIFMKCNIDCWRLSSMPICIVWSRSGYGRSLTIQGICWNTLNPGRTWCNESSASAALVLASLSTQYRFWSCRGFACQEGHNLQVRSLDTRTKNRYAAQDDVYRNTQGNLQTMLVKPVCNAWSCHLHRECCNTRSWWWDFVQRSKAGVHTGVPLSAPLGSFATVHPAASVEYSGSWSESVGERPLRHCALRASGRSSKIDWQFSYIQATLSRRQRNSRGVFRWTWRSREPVYPPLWALTSHRLARYDPGVSLLTWFPHHQPAVCISV